MSAAVRGGRFDRGDRARIVRRARERALKPKVGAVEEVAKEEGRENGGRGRWRDRCVRLRLG